MAASDVDAPLRGHSVFWNEHATGPFKLHLKKFGNVIWGYYCF